jgi:8-hydroxy-5-deazaflavin:NADPH oxidoreductase
MRVGIVGAGRIGSNLAAQWAKRGHDVLISFKRDENALSQLAEQIGARWGSVGDAVDHGDVAVVSVPWSALDDLAPQVRVRDKVLVDTTNQFAGGGVTTVPGGVSAAEYNAERFDAPRLVKAFNTYTSAFQADVGDGRISEPMAMFLAGEDADAKTVVTTLVRDAGFEPIDLGGWPTVSIMEAPRRPGAVYGESYRPEAAQRIAAAAATDLDEAARLATELKEPG